MEKDFKLRSLSIIEHVNLKITYFASKGLDSHSCPRFYSNINLSDAKSLDIITSFCNHDKTNKYGVSRTMQHTGICIVELAKHCQNLAQSGILAGLDILYIPRGEINFRRI